MLTNDPIQFVVTVTIKSPTSNPVDITYYRGEDRVQALGALMTAATMDIRDMDMPESIRTSVLAVRMDVLPIECSGKIPGNASVPYCHNNTGGCALHYPNGRGDAPVSGNDVLVDGATDSTETQELDGIWYFKPEHDRALAHLNNKRLTSVKPLDETMYDREETGPMWAVTVEGFDGVIHVFDNEMQRA